MMSNPLVYRVHEVVLSKGEFRRLCQDDIGRTALRPYAYEHRE